MSDQDQNREEIRVTIDRIDLSWWQCLNLAVKLTVCLILVLIIPAVIFALFALLSGFIAPLR